MMTWEPRMVVHSSIAAIQEIKVERGQAGGQHRQFNDTVLTLK